MARAAGEGSLGEAASVGNGRVVSDDDEEVFLLSTAAASRLVMQDFAHISRLPDAKSLPPHWKAASGADMGS